MEKVVKVEKNGGKWLKVGNSGEKVGEKLKKWGKVRKSEKKGRKRGEKLEKVGIFFFTKWPLVAILDDRKSLSIAFLAISDQYPTFFFFFFSKWPPAAILDPDFYQNR